MPGYVNQAVNLPTACAPWATSAQVTSLGTRFDGLDAYTVQDALAMATDILYLLSGRRWPGVCGPVTVRPCAQGAATRNIRDWSHDQSWGFCGCASIDSCGCSGRNRISLGASPIVAVSAVKIDGAVIAASRYRLDGEGPAGSYEWLVASGTNPAPFPCCQDLTLPDTATGTFSVTFTYGAAPPPGGVVAVAVTAGEIARWLSGMDDCSLGPGIRAMSRQGVSIDVIDPGGSVVDDLPQMARTWVRSVNPHNLVAEPSFWTPDGVTADGPVVRHT